MVGRPNAIKSGGRGSPPCATALKRQLHNRKWHRSRLWSLELAGSSRDGSAMCTPARAGPSTSSRIHHPWMLLWTDTGEEYQHDYCAYVLAYDEEGPRSRAMCAVADEGWGCQPSPARDFAVSLHCRRGDAPVVRGVSRRTNRQGGRCLNRMLRQSFHQGPEGAAVPLRPRASVGGHRLHVFRLRSYSRESHLALLKSTRSTSVCWPGSRALCRPSSCTDRA